MQNKLFVAFGFLGLVLVYVFQRVLFYDPFQDLVYQPGQFNEISINHSKYIFGKISRYILNDGFALMIIWGLFQNKKYLRFAVIIFMIGLLILLPIYITLSLMYYETIHTFLNHLHRLVLNPVLMMLLIPAFYYQNRVNPQD